MKLVVPGMQFLTSQLIITSLYTVAVSNAYEPTGIRDPPSQPGSGASDTGTSRRVVPCSYEVVLSDDLTHAAVEVVQSLSLREFYVVFEDRIDACLLRGLWNKGLGLKTVTVSHWWNVVGKISYQQATQHLLIGSLTWITETLVKIFVPQRTQWLWVVTGTDREIPTGIPAGISTPDPPTPSRLPPRVGGPSTNASGTSFQSASFQRVAEEITAVLGDVFNGVVLVEERRRKTVSETATSSSSWVAVGAVDLADPSWRRISLAAIWAAGARAGSEPRTSRALWPEPVFDFQGQEVRISCLQVEKAAVFEFDEDKLVLSAARGYLAEVIQIMMSRLNLTGALLPTDGGGSLLNDGTWSGIVGVLTRNEAAIGALDFTPSASRSEVIDFSAVIGEDPTIIFSSAPVILVKPFLLLQIFSKEVWACLIALMVVSSLALWVFVRAESEMDDGDETFKSLPSGLERRKEKKKKEKKKSQGSVFTYFMMMYMILVLQGTNFSPKSLPGRIVTSLMFLVALIICSLYNGSITAFLVIPFKSKPINTVDDLLSAKVTPVVRAQTNIQTNTVNKKEGALYPARSRVAIMTDDYVASVEFHEAMAKGTYALVDVFSSAVGRANQFTKRGEKCKYHLSTDNVQVNPDAIAFRKNSPYIVQCDFMQNPQLQYFGIMQYVKKKHVTVLCETEVSSGGPKPMSLLQTQGPFFVLGAGYVSAFLTLLLEILWRLILRNPITLKRNPSAGSRNRSY
ncbi:LOW QUALITY PROTEIN: uncharacterized protein LOC135200638 [Macrobrachium nipponense]|uniref:LOW QUALITY PROTEIN: uncharacterized protein LOC135200638 n=1 Tax=Macrobrachium nipponense TaxID=159736 RepID=UPI0030C863E0